MLHRVIKQQNLLNRIFIKSYIGFSIVVLLLTLTFYNILKNEDHFPINLINGIFPRYFIFTVLMPIYLLTLLTTLVFRTQDIFFSESKNIIFFQAIYRIVFLTLGLIIIWSIGTLISIYQSGFGAVLKEIWLEILVREGYFWLCCFLLGIIEILIYFLINNKLLAFLFSFAVSSFSFFLNSFLGMPSLFYDFYVGNYKDLLTVRGPILIATAGLLITLLSIVNKRRELA